MDNSDKEQNKSCELFHILIQYDQMGFKLIPIDDDGVTPNVNGILTQEEQLISITESGKVEPVNYICNHPEFWNEERLRKESHRFKNVATALGKIRLKAADGTQLYLNALDIDSEQVDTILSRVRGSDGNELYFIDKACKSTFVTRSRKKHSRHIFWLSDRQHKPIITSDCKLRYEFEIKTSFGLIALPESRHRDDPKFHYKKIGVDKIKRFDRMYDLLLDTLKDCLKTKNSGDTSHYSKNDKYNPEINLSDEQIELLYQSLSPYYRIGYRHQITYGLSGLLHKHYVNIESSTSLIQKLSLNDEEKDNRLVILHSTYEKNAKEVTGYQYLLSVLENVVDGCRAYAKSILRNILSIISVRQRARCYH